MENDILNRFRYAVLSTTFEKKLSQMKTQKHILDQDIEHIVLFAINKYIGNQNPQHK